MTWMTIWFWASIVFLGGLLLAFNLSIKPWRSPRRQWEGRVRSAFRERKPGLVDRLFDTRVGFLRSLRFEVTFVVVMNILFITAMGLLAYAFLA